MEGNQMETDGAQPFELLVANDAVEMCDELESDFRNTGDYCHNNIGCKTWEDWERMDKFLVAAADKIRSVHDCVKSLVALYSRQKLRNCDVLTADEQEKRWHKNCGHGIPNCKRCKVYAKAKESGLVDDRGFLRCSCEFIWAQMPYEAQEGGAK